MADSRVNRENYILVQGWMLTDIHLKGNELLVYACIFGFSQCEGQVFNGSLQYLADWTNSTKQGVSKCLKSLVEKGYLEKNDKTINGVKFCEYYATKFNRVCNKVVWGMQQSCMGGMQQSLTNNIAINNIENKNRNKKGIPSLDEVKAYCQERGNNVDAEAWYNFYSSKGWMVGKNPMVDWQAAVRTWERRTGNGRSKRTDFDPYPEEW